jgi:hypothetical protein
MTAARVDGTSESPEVSAGVAPGTTTGVGANAAGVGRASAMPAPPGVSTRVGMSAAKVGRANVMPAPPGASSEKQEMDGVSAGGTQG